MQACKGINSIYFLQVPKYMDWQIIVLQEVVHLMRTILKYCITKYNIHKNTGKYKYHVIQYFVNLIGCDSNHFGFQCAQLCGCQNNAKCDPVTGFCTCQPGWSGQFCTESKYG